jgi:hypothetical protein
MGERGAGRALPIAAGLSSSATVTRAQRTATCAAENPGQAKPPSTRFSITKTAPPRERITAAILQNHVNRKQLLNKTRIINRTASLPFKTSLDKLWFQNS